MRLFSIFRFLIVIGFFGIVIYGQDNLNRADEQAKVKKHGEENKAVRISDVEVVVSATRTPHQLLDVPVETTVVTKERIQKSNAKNVGEVLRDVPGFYILNENVAGSSAYRSRLRGFDFDRGYGLVLIDGERVLGGGMGEYGISLNQIPLEMIDRIEIVKGPGSALYGSDVIAGVVNIITKPIPERPVLTATAGYGSYGTSSIYGGYGRKIKKFGFLLSAQRETSERGRYEASEDDFEGVHLSTKLSYDLSNRINLSCGINYDDNKWRYHIDEKVRVSPSFNIVFPDSSTLKLKGYHLKLDMDSFSPGYTRRFGDISYTQAEVQYTKPFGKKHLLTVGSEYLVRDIDANFAKNSVTWRSLYLQDEIAFKPFYFVLGGRIDDHSTYGTQLNPRLALRLDISEKSRLRVMVGRSFKSPTIRQLYVFFKHGAWWNKPNENLNPEISWGYSIGLEHTFSDNVSANVNVFRNDVKDIVVPVDSSETIGNVPVRTWRNIQKAYTQGAELGLKTTILDNLSLNLGYTYLDTKNIETLKKLPYSPHNTGSVGIDYELTAWGLSLHWRTYCSSEDFKDEANTKKAEGYYISNLNIIKKISKNINFSLNVDNIFESDYGEPERKWLGRVIFGKITYNF